MEKGMIFNIQKFSIHDGPGIRTTVFLKGCPLRCKWCANPESQIEKVQILYDQNKCVHCQSCVHAYLQGAIKHTDEKIRIDPNLCVGCLSCVHTCLQNALSHEGDRKSVQEVVDVCLQDLPFYEESNGGVTISGGEGMAQPQFLHALLDELHKYKIHVAIETTGYIQPDIFEPLALKLDLLLFDMKHYDTDCHKEGTGVYNELILRNLKWVKENNISVLVRIPVIPGFNDSLKDAAGFVKVLKERKIDEVQILPFHQFGERKYQLLSKDYAYSDVKALHPEDLKDYQQIFIDNGIHCFF